MARIDYQTFGRVETFIGRKRAIKVDNYNCIYSSTDLWWGCGDRFIVDPTKFGTYIGIQNDPLGKTNVLYHVRFNQEWERDLSRGIKHWHYFRVNDLVQVYHNIKYHDRVETVTVEFWDEYLNGGLTEYQGTFSKNDFHAPGCIYTAAHSFLE